MAEPVFKMRDSFRGRAVLIGERLDLRALEVSDRLASTPLTLRVGEHGCVVLFRYGVAVFFDAAPMEETAFLQHLQRFVQLPFAIPETDQLDFQVQPNAQELLTSGVLSISDTRIERLQIVADILAKSVVLEEYEKRIAAAFDRAEPIAAAMEIRGATGQSARELIRHIGSGLLSLHRMVGRVEVGEKPELLWEHPELEILYLRLVDEYELNERQTALERKLDVITRTAETQLDLLQTARSLRVEWYIVILIVVEILLTLYEMFWH
jgi:uncharacterized Rmd1/YagE family protein